MISRGQTQPPGGPHAEILALNEAGSRARGADLYVTLEPCTFWGRTPPCTDAIIAAGIHRVFFGATDPDPRIGNGAKTTLQQAGIESEFLPDASGVADELLAPFRCRIEKQRPFVTGKYAMSLDGKIATRSGDSHWITGPLARKRVHELRDHVDAIIVGVNTVITDNPELTTRIDNHWRPVKHPLRVIIDSHGRTPHHARLLEPGVLGRSLFATVDAPLPWREAIIHRGGEVVTVGATSDGKIDLHSLLRLLAERGYSHVLVEGGSTLLGTFFREQLIDRLWVFIAPKLIGGHNALGPIGGPGIERMADALPLRVLRCEQYGDDLLMITQPLIMEP
ncbi:MAG: bifunctional diaminohydroxyphosphoribosylaminopyrimidine deaminase/5-amino-6-(5-phosphoribosylamino)uracil reductase RibD [Herpetosiphon sp.]